MLNIPPEEAQFDQFGRPLHPLAAAIHNQAMMSPNLNYSPVQAPVPAQANYTPAQTEQTSSQVQTSSPIQANYNSVPVTAPTQQQQTNLMPNYRPPEIDTNPIPITPALPTTAEAAKASLKVPQINDPQYKQGKLRTVFNAIAAGLAGAGGAKAGMDTADALRNVKYNRAMTDYEANLKHIEGQQTSEKEQVGRAEKEISLGIQKGAAKGKIESLEELNRIREENAQTSANKAADYGRNISSLTEQRAAKEKQIEELTKKEADRNEQLRKVIEEQDPEKKAAALKAYQDLYYAPKEDAGIKAGKVREAQIAADNSPAGMARIANQAGARIVATGTPAALSAEKAASGAKAEGAAEANTSPDMIERKARLARAISLATLTANVKDTSHKAQIALDAFPDIRADLKAASDTLFADRWKEFRTKTLGTEDSKQYASLRANVELLQTIISQVHTGNKGSSKILTKFTDLFNVNKMDRKTFEDSVNVVEKWLKRYAALPPLSGGYDLADIDKAVESPGTTGKYGIIKVGQ